MMPGNNGDGQPTAKSELRFGQFRLDTANRLWRGNQEVNIRPRPLAMLRYLAERPGQPVTKEELRKRLWPGIYVSPVVVRVCVREIRQALGDEATQSQFIETVGGQGYRFIGQVVSSQYSVASRQKAGGDQQPLEATVEQLTTDNWLLTTPFIGREHELEQLQGWYERVQQGERHLIFISGEAGIGKTTLVDYFLAQIQRREVVRLGCGHCVEQQGHGEAYLPVLQALQQMCRASDGDQVAAVLRRYAPMWLVQMSGVIEASELEMLQRQVQGSSPQRMLRECAEALEMLAAETSLLLFLEDLQWSDGATLELLEYLARRQEQARLLIIGTYRPADTVMSAHSLRRVVQKLVGRRQCYELALELWTEAEVEAYLTRRLGGSPIVAVLRPVMHRRTDGNALFVAHFVDYLYQQGLLVQSDERWELQGEPSTIEKLIPGHVQRLIARQIERLSKEEQQLLAVASVVGMTFTASEVAAVVNGSLEEVEAEYDNLANQEQFIAVRGLAEWPNGVLTVRYGFRHALYQHVLYNQIGLARRVRWHRQLGGHFATTYGERAQGMAGEVAVHFEQGRDYQRAVIYRQQAGAQALQQSAYQKALEHGRAGLVLLGQLPATTERRQLELKLRKLVSIALTAIGGFSDTDLEENLHRSQQLCHELGDEVALVPVVIGLIRLQLVRASRVALEELARQEEFLTEHVHEAPLLVQLHTQLVTIEAVRGMHKRAEEHYQHVRAHYDPQIHHSVLYAFAGDPLALALITSGMSLSLAGWLDQGWNRVSQGLAYAREITHPLALAMGLLYAALVKQLRGEPEEAWQFAYELCARTREYGFSLYALGGILFQGCAAVQRGTVEEGVAAITSGLAQYRATGAQFLVPYFLSFLADGYRRQGKVAEALQVVNEALGLTATNLDVFWEAELYRRKGELSLQMREQKKERKGENCLPSPTPPFAHSFPEAETYFHQAIEIAHRQGAKLLELRAVMSLSQLWQQQGKKAAARSLLSEIYAWFTEGFDTRDLRTAKALLAELS